MLLRRSWVESATTFRSSRERSVTPSREVLFAGAYRTSREAASPTGGPVPPLREHGVSPRLAPPPTCREGAGAAGSADHRVAAADAQHLAGDVAGDGVGGEEHHGVGDVAGAA